MATHYLSDHFNYFFSRLNPSPSFRSTASSQYNTIKGLIEDRAGRAGSLSPQCFLQGSYGQETAIYTINDVDIVTLCELWQPASGGSPGTRIYGRDEIFGIIAAPLLNDKRYNTKVRYHSGSMCIKVELGIKVEILPVVYASGNFDAQKEPFRLWRPETGQWEDGYARQHQALLTQKNKAANGNFIPMVKVLKHLRSSRSLDAVSFHVECLLYSIPDWVFFGAPADYIADVLEYIANTDASTWYGTKILTPCGERDIFTRSEWSAERWFMFHQAVTVWAKGAVLAKESVDKAYTIKSWQAVLGANFFPTTVS
jgi:hypothetical protein